MKKSLRLFLFIIVMGSGALMLVLWSKYVEPKWGTIQVIEASKELERGHVISTLDLKTINVKAEQIVAKRVKDTSKILGQETTRLIRNGEQITEDMLVMDQLTPKKDQVNMPMPNEWVLSMPGSLLRGDHITLLPVKNTVLSDQNTTKTDESGKQSIIKNEIEVIPDDVLAKLTDIPVSYSKASNNQEVTSSDDRKKPSGPVNRFEMLVNNEQRNLIAQYGGTKGYKFIVTYR
jgi:hypothetical protein